MNSLDEGGWVGRLMVAATSRCRRGSYRFAEMLMMMALFNNVVQPSTTTVDSLSPPIGNPNVNSATNQVLSRVPRTPPFGLKREGGCIYPTVSIATLSSSHQTER